MKEKLCLNEEETSPRDEEGHSWNYWNKHYLLKDIALKAKEWLGRDCGHLLTLPGMSLVMSVILKISQVGADWAKTLAEILHIHQKQSHSAHFSWKNVYCSICLK